MPSESAGEHYRSYLAELDYLQAAATEFAGRYPAVAARLELGGQGSSDPHVERLLESFAFLSARLQRKIDGQLPIVAQALLETLYPALVAPVPSMAIAQFIPDPEQSRSATGFTLPRGLAVHATSESHGTCRFRSAYPVTLWPLEIAEAEFMPPTIYEFLNDRPDVATVLRVRVACCGHRTFAEFDIDTLRLFINGPPTISTTLYELLLNRTCGIAVLSDEACHTTKDGQIGGIHFDLTADHIRPVGFASEEAVLPGLVQAHDAYRLIQEYFTFPDKFLFIDLLDLNAVRSSSAQRYVDFLLLLTERPKREVAINQHTFQLGCTPIINLFERTAEPIRVDETQLSYRLVADCVRETTTEIHSIKRISSTAIESANKETICPYFSFDHQSSERNPHVFWVARREPAARADLSGTDVWLSFVDKNFDPEVPPTRAAFAHVLCTNRNMAEQIPANALLGIEVDAPISTVVCLKKPTRQIDTRLGGESLWQVVSHLSLNYLSLSDGPDSLSALKEILRLYMASDSALASKQIAGLKDLTTRRIVRRVGDDAWRGFRMGTEIEVTVDEANFAGASAFIFGSVLDHFFSLYTAMNSFTQLVLKSRQQSRIWKTWPSRSGEGIIL